MCQNLKHCLDESPDTRPKLAYFNCMKEDQAITYDQKFMDDLNINTCVYVWGGILLFISIDREIVPSHLNVGIDF